MYFINEKAGAMSTNGNHISFEKGLPALYRAQGANPERKIIIWRDVCKNIHVETSLSDVDKIVAAIRAFEAGKEYY